MNNSENKKLLWQLLYENNVFLNIPEKKFNDIKIIFEEEIKNIDNAYANIDLTEKNKKLIRVMVDRLKFFKTNKSLKPLEEVELKINQDFENKKEEMFQLLKKPTQNDIDFNEETDKPINDEEMENILNNMMKKRNFDINNDNNNNSKKVNFNLDNNDSNNINNSDNNFYTDKKEYDDYSNTFLEKLKFNDNTKKETNIEDMLKKILENQYDILNILKKSS